MDQKAQLDQDVQQFQQALTQAREQAATWQVRVNKLEGALEFAQMQLKRYETEKPVSEPQD